MVRQTTRGRTRTHYIVESQAAATSEALYHFNNASYESDYLTVFVCECECACACECVLFWVKKYSCFLDLRANTSQWVSSRVFVCMYVGDINLFHVDLLVGWWFFCCCVQSTSSLV